MKEDGVHAAPRGLDHGPGAWLYGLDTKRWPRVVTPVKEAPPLSSSTTSPSRPPEQVILRRNQFGAIRPLLYVMAIYGFIPVTINPPGIGTHPFRSTILWVVTVNLLTGWSISEVLWTNFAVQFGMYDSKHQYHRPDVDLKLVAIQGIIHVSSHSIVFLLWLEIPKLRKCLLHWDEFFENHGRFIRGMRSSRRLICVSWTIVVLATIIFPILVTTFVLNSRIVDNSGRWKPELRQMPAHLYQIVFVTSMVATFAVFCYTVSDMAMRLCQRLEKDIAADTLTPARVKAFRLAWLSLRELLKTAVALPAVGITLIGYLLLIITFSVYHSIASLYKGMIALTMSSVFILVHSVLLLLWSCDSAYQAKASINAFVEPLRTGDWTEMSPELRSQFQQLEHVVEAFPADVSLAGYFSLERSSFLTMGAYIITYVIVLLQFRQDEENMMESSVAMNLTTPSDTHGGL